jgi:ribosomal protein S12 methylthiotransferase
VPAAVKRRRQTSLMRLQRRIVQKAQRSRIGSQVRVLIDGPSAEHDLVLQGRMEGQAPDIDPLVYLTDCDPSALTAGQFIQAEVVANRAYDLVARPLSGAELA